MRRARERIDESKRRQILPEDLLASMLEMNHCDANQLLAKFGVPKRQLQSRLEVEYAEWSSYQESSDQSTVRSYMSTAVRKIIDAALLETAHEQAFSLSTRHLLIGILEQSDGSAKKALIDNGITLEAVRATSIPTVERSGDNPDQIVTGNPFKVSPVFLAVILLTAIAGYASYANWVANGIFVFLFVLGGWIISLALHEFGHAVVAYRAGDRSVAKKGYLSLNPHYTEIYATKLLGGCDTILSVLASFC